MTVRPVASSLRLPRANIGVVKASDFDNAMQMIERADAVDVKLGQTPTFPAVILVASDGSTWRLVVEPGGALATTPVARS